MTGTADPRPPEEIERDIEATRAEMAETLDVIERKLSPGQLIDQAVDYLRAEGTGSRVGEVIKRNPLPVVLIGVGLAWLALSELSRRPGDPRGHRTAADDRRPDPLAYAAAAGAAAGREHLVAWLRDAHAMEQQAIEMLEKMAGRLEHYPELRARIEEHLRQTHSQAERVERCLERLGAGTSGLKTAAGKITGGAQQLSGLFASDEVIKGGIADYAFERYEIACYEVLIAAAEQAGEPETRRVCEEILSEEEAMAAWLADHLPELTRRYLAREAAGEAAKPS